MNPVAIVYTASSLITFTVVFLIYRRFMKWSLPASGAPAEAVCRACGEAGASGPFCGGCGASREGVAG